MVSQKFKSARKSVPRSISNKVTIGIRKKDAVAEAQIEKYLNDAKEDFDNKLKTYNALSEEFAVLEKKWKGLKAEISKREGEAKIKERSLETVKEIRGAKLSGTKVKVKGIEEEKVDIVQVEKEIKSLKEEAEISKSELKKAKIDMDQIGSSLKKASEGRKKAEQEKSYWDERKKRYIPYFETEKDKADLLNKMESNEKLMAKENDPAHKLEEEVKDTLYNIEYIYLKAKLISLEQSLKKDDKEAGIKAGIWEETGKFDIADMNRMIELSKNYFLSLTSLKSKADELLSQGGDLASIKTEAENLLLEAEILQEKANKDWYKKWIERPFD